jgi:K+-sensing histidine kinase KdpD
LTAPGIRQTVIAAARRAGEQLQVRLALTKRLVELHGGRTSVAGQPGKGSVFTVEIPLDPDAQNDESIAAEATRQAG